LALNTIEVVDGVSKGEGFEVLFSKDGTPVCRIHYSSPELIHALHDSRASSIIIEPYWEDRGQGLAFLADFSRQIRKLTISTPDLSDLSVVTRMENLEDLATDSSVETVDFSQLPRLRRCLLAHGSGIGNISACVPLEELSLFHVRIHDLTSLSVLGRLRRLSLNDLRSLASLGGIEGLPLQEVRLLYLRRLTSVAPLARLQNLQTLEIVSCKAIRDSARIGDISSLEDLASTTGPTLPSLEFLKEMTHLRRAWIGNTEGAQGSVSLAPLAPLQRLQVLGLFSARNAVDVERLGELQSLEQLVINRGPELPSLAFLTRLGQLRELGIYNTKIRDGNLGVLLNLPRLQRVHAITPRGKHHSHTDQQIDTVLAARHPDRPPPSLRGVT
jgi:Leucine-rich repeat (LRR) protein